MGQDAVTRRLISLDAFRGLTILGMLMVNNMALDTATPKILTHAPWNAGVYIADVIFPWFLLIVGVALPFSFASHQKKSLSYLNFTGKALSRCLMLVLLGCFIDSSLLKQPVFDLGVLQLIGLAFLVSALTIKLPNIWRAAIAGVLLLSHWAALRWIPVPGYGAGWFTESQNLINYLNNIYLQPLHLKGLISVVPTSAMVIIGSLMGDYLRASRHSPGQKFRRLIISGAALIMAGWLWNLDLPFSKAIWSASYILYTAGLGFMVLGILYALIDVKLWSAWAYPLVVFGSNAITAYVLPIIVKIHVFMEWSLKAADGSRITLQQAGLDFCLGLGGRYWGGWLYTMLYIIIWWLFLYIMYRKKIFLRI